MKITRENLKNIVREAMVEESAYQEFFKKALEKTGKSIPQMSDEEKKAFFNKIDSAWKGKGEKKESVDEIEEEAVVVSKRTPSGNIVSKLKEENESTNEELTDAQKKLPPALQKAIEKKDGKDESVNESSMEIKKLEDAIKMFQDKIKKQGRITNARDEEHLSALIKVYKQMGGTKIKESTNERMGSDKGAVGNANFNNRLKAMRDAKNSIVVYIDTNKGKKLLKVFKTQQTAQQFKKKNMDKLLNTKGVESVGTMPKKEWDAKEAKYAIK